MSRTTHSARTSPKRRGDIAHDSRPGIVEFSHAYAEQNERDHKALTDAAESGRITAETGL